MIVLSGDRDGHRLRHAVATYREAGADRLLLSGGPVYRDRAMADIMRKYALELGVPAAAILLERRSTSTRENALFSRTILFQRGISSAVVVTSDYHMWRARQAFERAFDGSGIRLSYSPAPSGIDLQHWWRSPLARELVVLEYVKWVAWLLPDWS